VEAVLDPFVQPDQFLVYFFYTRLERGFVDGGLGRRWNVVSGDGIPSGHDARIRCQP
jgi:hypothetical protein